MGAMELWLRESGPAFLRTVGIRKGDRVLDFGCGPGGYAVPLALVVGPEGRVVAVDRDAARLESLEERAVEFHVRDVIEVRRTDGSLALDRIDEGSLDAALLFDVLQHVEDWDTLFASLRRVLKSGGLMLVNPSRCSHPGRVDVERLNARLTAHGFALERIEHGRVMHYDFLHEEEILVFRAP